MRLDFDGALVVRYQVDRQVGGLEMVAWMPALSGQERLDDSINGQNGRDGSPLCDEHRSSRRDGISRSRDGPGAIRVGHLPPEYQRGADRGRRRDGKAPRSYATA